MIVTAGENVVDMIGKGGGIFHAVAGGSPLNIAVALGRLKVRCGYAMPVSSDALGSMLLSSLEKEGVRYLPQVRPDRPTGLALVSVTDKGQPVYSFYREGAADIDLRPGELPRLPPEATHLHVGGSPSLGNDHCGDMLTEWALDQAEAVSLSIDPNVRPALVENKERFLARCDRLMEKCDVFRLSDEDAEYMYGALEPEQIAENILAKGVAMAVVTQGEQGVLFATENDRVQVEAASAGPVSDTVAAGDCFFASLLAWMLEHGCLQGGRLRTMSATEIEEAGMFAAAGAAINCSRDGCDPPTRKEIQALLGKPG